MKRYEISTAVSSKMMDIEAFDANFPCAKDAENREEQVDQTWQHNVRDDKEKMGLDVFDRVAHRQIKPMHLGGA